METVELRIPGFPHLHSEACLDYMRSHLKKLLSPRDEQNENKTKRQKSNNKKVSMSSHSGGDSLIEAS